MKIGKYLRNPLEVQAVRVDKSNMYDVAKWCDGEVLTDDKDPQNPKKFVRVKAFKPVRMETAQEGDWILKSEKGFKVYSNFSFLRDFAEIGNVGEAMRKMASVGSQVIHSASDGEYIQQNT